MMKRIYLLALILCLGVSSLAQSISGVVNIYRKVNYIDSASARIKLSDVSGLTTYIGNKALIIQMKGATMDQSNTSTFGNITTINEAGYYEIGTICGFLNDTVVMERKLNNFYNTAGLVQFVILPRYTNATVVDTLKAAPWNDSTGGVVAIEVTGTLTLNKPITANGMGFKGGSWTQYGSTCRTNFAGGPVTDYWMPYLANDNKTAGKKGEGIAAYISGREYAQGKQVSGGGGGNNLNAGGGGGSNYSAGGNGGNRINTGIASCQSNSPGRGGLALSGVGYSLSPSTQNRIFLGGGGGAGHDDNSYGIPGGNGGGLIFILANAINGNSGTASDNKIMANGDRGYRYLPAPYSTWSFDAASDGAGGGGAGGTVILRVNSYTGNNITVEAKGAIGGGTETGGQTQCNGPGGGGGGGVVWFSQSSTPATVSASVTGGTNGTTSVTASCPNAANTATSGTNGATLFNFSLAAPRDSSAICKQILPIRFELQLSGVKNIYSNHLQFSCAQFAMVQKAFLEASSDGRNFYLIHNWSSVQQTSTYHDRDHQVNRYYRVRILSISGSQHYSRVLNLGGLYTSLHLSLFPNPVQNELQLQVDSEESGTAVCTIWNMDGVKLKTLNLVLSRGAQQITIPVTEFSSGVFRVTLQTKNEQVTGSFFKLF